MFYKKRGVITMNRVFVEDIVPGMVIESDIFKEGSGGKVPLLSAGSTVTAKFLYQLQKHGVKYIFTNNPAAFGEKYIDLRSAKGENPFKILGLDVEKSKSVIAPKTREAALKTMKDFHISISGSDIEEIRKAATDLSNMIERVLREFPDNPRVIVNVHQLRSSDNNHIYKHLLSVSVIAMSIAQFLSFQKEDILQLGKCAALHDIGLFFVSPEILNKVKPLEDDEFEMIKKHPVTGYKLLKKLGIFEDAVCDGIACHHERLNGTGYPLGLKGEKIPLWSRIIAVADVYDSMTNPRSYRKARSPSEACEYIMASANHEFEFDIVTALVRRIEFYPVGICVELSDRNRAVVVNNSANKLRPTVKILPTNVTADLNSDPAYAEIMITRVLKFREIIEEDARRKSKFAESDM
jgi:HD-GYP domain-containing protein (c-di-GMP phosphodiesterase class II)